VSPIVRKQRQSHAPPPEGVHPDRVRPSRPPSMSPSQSRRTPTLLRSPHADKDRADYILPVPSHTRQHLSARARSSTPIPPYEPPAERFTPPREIFRASPRVSKSSKRKKVLKVMIKKEPPEIDLSLPPPPSPTDDPLLLHGRVRSPRPPIPTHARETPLLESTPPGPSRQISPFKCSALDFPLPGIPSDVDDNEDANIPEQPVFNFAAGAGEGSWSSSDGGLSEQEGEYTGKFRVMHVPTKADPPTSATRERIEQWGRPISPFPRKGSPIPEKGADNEADETSDLDLPLAQPQLHVEKRENRNDPEALEDAQGLESEVHQEMSKDMVISETTDIMLANDFAYDNVKPVTDVEATLLDQQSRDAVHEGSRGQPAYPQEDVGARLELGDESAGLKGNTPVQEQDETQFHPVTTPQENIISTQISDVHGDSSQGEPVGGQTDEEIVVRALSEEPPQLKSPPQHTPEPLSIEEHVEVDEPMAETLDAESEGDSSDDSDLSVVKIVSDDPWAAARAAAILKQVCPMLHTCVFTLILPAARLGPRHESRSQAASFTFRGIPYSQGSARGPRKLWCLQVSAVRPLGSPFIWSGCGRARCHGWQSVDDTSGTASRG
jgi:hypothetical protein